MTIGVAIATMTLGNLAAMTQTNIKRFFGYSTIAHVGYLLLGLVAAADGSGEGLRAIVIYLIVYAFMNLGAFAVIIMMRRKDIIGDEIDDLSGLMSRAPALAVLMLIFLLSLAGIPPTAGFIGKYFIFALAHRNRALLFGGAGGWLFRHGAVLLLPDCGRDVHEEAVG